MNVVSIFRDISEDYCSQRTVTFGERSPSRPTPQCSKKLGESDRVRVKLVTGKLLTAAPTSSSPEIITIGDFDIGGFSPRAHLPTCCDALYHERT